MADDQNRRPEAEVTGGGSVNVTFDISAPDDIGELAEGVLNGLRDTLRNSGALRAALSQGDREKMNNSDYMAIPFPIWPELQEAIEGVLASVPAWEREIIVEVEQLAEELKEELKKPIYEGLGIGELFDAAERDDDGRPVDASLFMQALNAAQAAATVAAQQNGRDQRRAIKEKAREAGAIMELKTGLITFSDKELWDAFAPGKISKIGTLPRDEIDEETGLILKRYFAEGEIVDVKALEFSFKAFTLLSAIRACSVENFQEQPVSGGAVTFYVKGVLDKLGVDPRIRDDGQLDMNRKTAGALYLENQFAPLLPLIGTLPDGSRYSVFNYDGYDANTDTMTIRTPYIYQLWKRAQGGYFERKSAVQGRIDDGKRPLKKDFKPLAVNSLFKLSSYKEDDTVLEIATTITDILLRAGKQRKKGIKTTEISFHKLIADCSRLREELDNVDEIKDGQLGEKGKVINKNARYNSVLRKIERAYNLIMNPDKCDALNHFDFISFVIVTKEGKTEPFKAPTKGKLGGKIQIMWRRIDT